MEFTIILTAVIAFIAGYAVSYGLMHYRIYLRLIAMNHEHPGFLEDLQAKLDELKPHADEEEK